MIRPPHGQKLSIRNARAALKCAHKPRVNIERNSMNFPHVKNAWNHCLKPASSLSISAIKQMFKRKFAVHTRKGVASVQPVKACNQRGRQVFRVTRLAEVSHKRAHLFRNLLKKLSKEKNPYVGWCLAMPSRTMRIRPSGHSAPSNISRFIGSGKHG